MIFKKKKQPEPRVPQKETYDIKEFTYSITIFYRDGRKEQFEDVESSYFPDYIYFPQSYYPGNATGPTKGTFGTITFKKIGTPPEEVQHVVSILAEDIQRREQVTHTKTITMERWV